MARVLELAERGRGYVSPNPMVGCVIVKDDKIIAEGYHRKYGGPHAEAEAINSAQDKKLFIGADLYVNLEPCAHHGKTPPCADLITQFPFRRVVIANRDSNPLVSGKGIGKIRAAGIEVTENILAQEGRELNKRFFTFMEKQRPFIILKWAQTEDGFIARKDFSSKWISNALSRKLVHKWRSEEDSIMAGTNTVLYDNPRLNVRDWRGKQPVRIFIDKNLKIKGDFFLLDQTVPTICYNCVKNESSGNPEYVKINEDFILKSILQDLHKRKIQSVIIEGGKILLEYFIKENLWDEIRLFRSGQSFGEGIAAPVFQGKLIESNEVEDDILEIYSPE